MLSVAVLDLMGKSYVWVKLKFLNLMGENNLLISSTKLDRKIPRDLIGLVHNTTQMDSSLSLFLTKKSLS